MKILILCQSQFGYHIDTYYYVKELSKSVDVSYLCWDYSKPKYPELGETIYVKRDKNIIIRNLRYILTAIHYTFKSNSDVVFVKYFKGAFLLKILLPWKRFVLDIRTVSINRNAKIRFFEDLFLRFESFFFNNITVISRSVADKLNINRFKIVPLGADVISSKESISLIGGEINCLYVGTLNGRNIDVTVEALAIAVKKLPEIRFQYYIVGDGLERDTKKVKDAIEDNGLTDSVTMPGYLKHNELKQLFLKTHVGIAYVPVTDYYNVQPSTKIYEYIRSSIPVIATNTKANIDLVESNFGVLAGESAVDFADGILKLIDDITQGKIFFEKNAIKSFSWESVVEDLKKYLQSLV